MKYKNLLSLLFITVCSSLLVSCNDISGNYVNIYNDGNVTTIIKSIKLYLNNRCDFIIETIIDGEVTIFNELTCSWQRYELKPYPKQIHIITPNADEPGATKTFYGDYIKGKITEISTKNIYYKQ